MPTTEQLAEQITITVPKETAKVIHDAVASGEYESESAFVEARVRDFVACDISDEEFKREVLPVIEAMKADPSRGIPLEEARARMAERHKSYKSTAA